jgi:AcrR family transcriptional regulator
MTAPTDRRTRKRDTTRQGISDAATRLFMERGFDQVTIDDIASAADVARKTVFNHFARKEDMFFDLDRQGAEDVREAFRSAAQACPPAETLRRFAHQAVAEGRPYIRFFEGTLRFMETIQASEALQARARSIRDELTDTVAACMADALQSDHADPNVKLAAATAVSSWGVAFVEAHRVYRIKRDAVEAGAVFLALVDRGSLGVEAILAAGK